jgi:ubiquinone/menaquinone biosynthesis C-methylase UbiE
VSASAGTAFDFLAAAYDERWTNAPAGRLQRQAVWQHVDPLIERGHRVLDIGCGTGEDALHYLNLGAAVSALDASSEMVARARDKGVNAHVLQVEDIARLCGTYDAMLSNFGVLNCVRDLSSLREPSARLLRTGGHWAICLMGRFCLWEFGYYSLRGQFSKATRRWLGTTTASLGLRVYYPLVRQVRDALRPHFELRLDAGIGLCVPPSFVPELPAGLLNGLDCIDRRIAANRFFRGAADHRLLVFRKN